jgi:hypothetical protein
MDAPAQAVRLPSPKPVQHIGSRHRIPYLSREGGKKGKKEEKKTWRKKSKDDP